MFSCGLAVLKYIQDPNAISSTPPSTHLMFWAMCLLDYGMYFLHERSREAEEKGSHPWWIKGMKYGSWEEEKTSKVLAGDWRKVQLVEEWGFPSFCVYYFFPADLGGPLPPQCSPIPCTKLYVLVCGINFFFLCASSRCFGGQAYGCWVIKWPLHFHTCAAICLCVVPSFLTFSVDSCLYYVYKNNSQFIEIQVNYTLLQIYITAFLKKYFTYFKYVGAW